MIKRNGEAFAKYDERGNLIHYVDKNNYYEIRMKYDDNDRCTYVRQTYSGTDCHWHKYKYDEKGRITYYANSEGYKAFREYDENGNLTHYFNTDGIWKDYEYDEKGRCIVKKDNAKDEVLFYKYDDKSNFVRVEAFNGKTHMKEIYEYTNGKLIHHITPDGDELFATYNKNGDPTYTYIHGNEVTKYDKNCHVIEKYYAKTVCDENIMRLCKKIPGLSTTFKYNNIHTLDDLKNCDDLRWLCGNPFIFCKLINELEHDNVDISSLKSK